MSSSRWAVVVVAPCLLVTAAAVAYAAGKAKPAVPVQEVVRARRFELVDAAGKTRAVLGIDRRGEPELLLMQANGATAVTTRASAAGGTVEVYGWESGTDTGLVARMGVSKLGADVYLGGGTGAPSVSVGTGPFGTGINLSDSNRPRANVWVHRDGKPALTLYDQDGKARAVLGAVEMERTLTGATEETAESSLVLFDKEGKVLWQAP